MGQARYLELDPSTQLPLASNGTSRAKNLIIEYQDLGAAYFDQRERHRVERRLVQRLERLGYEVALQPRALAS
jgi:hypothetical protein